MPHKVRIGDIANVWTDIVSLHDEDFFGSVISHRENTWTRDELIIMWKILWKRWGFEEGKQPHENDDRQVELYWFEHEIYKLPERNHETEDYEIDGIDGDSDWGEVYEEENLFDDDRVPGNAADDEREKRKEGRAKEQDDEEKS